MLNRPGLTGWRWKIRSKMLGLSEANSCSPSARSGQLPARASAVISGGMGPRADRSGSLACPDLPWSLASALSGMFGARAVVRRLRVFGARCCGASPLAQLVYGRLRGRFLRAGVLRDLGPLPLRAAASGAGPPRDAGRNVSGNRGCTSHQRAAGAARSPRRHHPRVRSCSGPEASVSCSACAGSWACRRWGAA